jgi:hypothetical protein
MYSSSICVHAAGNQNPYPWAVDGNILSCDPETSDSIEQYDCDNCEEVCADKSPENREMNPPGGGCDYIDIRDETKCGVGS